MASVWVVANLETGPIQKRAVHPKTKHLVWIVSQKVRALVRGSVLPIRSVVLVPAMCAALLMRTQASTVYGIAANNCGGVEGVLTGGRGVCRFTCSTELAGKVVPYTPKVAAHGWPHFVTDGCSNIVHEMAQNSTAPETGGTEAAAAASTG